MNGTSGTSGYSQIYGASLFSAGHAWAALAQTELFGAVDRCPAVVHLELVVDVFGVGPHGVQGHHQLAGNVRAAQVGSEQSQHLTLALAQRLAHDLLDGRPVLGL